MRKTFFSIILFLISINIKAQNMDTTSYSSGMVLAEKMKELGVTDLDAESFTKGFLAVLRGEETILSVSEANQRFSTFVQAQAAKKHEVNKTAGETFLAENGKRDNVITLPSGLQYEILEQGTGPRPTASSKVKTHYHGTLIDGKVFDSSVQRGQPIEFPVNGVIKGWQEVLQLMQAGAKYRAYIPYHLAYGERGAPPSIPPYAALIFDIELISFE